MHILDQQLQAARVSAIPSTDLSPIPCWSVSQVGSEGDLVVSESGGGGGARL